MTAASLVTVTLARAWDPGDAAVTAGRIEFAIALDQHGRPDEEAWLADPARWPALRYDGSSTPQQGDVAHDEEGWQLRFHPGVSPDPDAPAFRLCHVEAGLRPGQVLTLLGPEGEETSWRVVGVMPRQG